MVDLNISKLQIFSEEILIISQNEDVPLRVVSLYFLLWFLLLLNDGLQL
tara:strand:- start:505 stop:651 length:147 start_codon:yes stop_codon:yes gene_type:complete